MRVLFDRLLAGLVYLQSKRHHCSFRGLGLDNLIPDGLSRPTGEALSRNLLSRALAVLLASLAILLCAFGPVAAAYRAGHHAIHEIYRTGVNHPRRYFAESTRDRSGRPTIIYYRRYSTAPGYFKSFIRNHEHCHLSGYRNEIAASCCALGRMKLSKSGLAAIRHYVVSRDVNSESAVDYQGQGRLFWSKIESRCLGASGRRLR
jgi:hypothetical protein